MRQPYGRVLGIAALILFAVSGIIYSKFGYSMLFPSQGPYINHKGDITGGDFLVFYNAAAMTLKGAAKSVWDHGVFEAQLQQIYGQEILKLHFFNPPPALLLWTPFGLLVSQSCALAVDCAATDCTGCVHLSSDRKLAGDHIGADFTADSLLCRCGSDGCLLCRRNGRVHAQLSAVIRNVPAVSPHC